MIFALATPVGQSALAIFRVSGNGCLEIFNKVLNKPVLKPREVCLRDISWQGFLIDRCSVVYYKSPKSFTGEDSVEVFCHGGLPVINSLTSMFMGLGFGEADPGGFSKRAYENGKLSLNEAEAVADLIHSEDEERSRLSVAAVSGVLTEAISLIGNDVDSLRVFIEGSIDFSDEDYDFIKEGDVENRLDVLKQKLVTLIDSALVSSKRVSKNRVLFYGPPNTGKSSLFNRLLGFERALVSNIPGTTRDLIDSEIFYNSVSLELVDSAGIRETKDLIESQGVVLSKMELNESDVVLIVLDRSTEGFIGDFLDIVKDNKSLLVFNKVDRDKPAAFFDCVVSAKTGEGVSNLKDVILSKIKENKSVSKKTFLIRGRHLELFQSALKHLNNCSININQEKDVDLAAEELRLVRLCFDEFLGVKFSDDLLGDIFKDFCIGK